MESRIFDLHDSVRAQLTSQLPAAREKGLVLDLILEVDSPRWVHGDSEGCAAGVFALIRKAISMTEYGGVAVRVESAFNPETTEADDRGENGSVCARVIIQGSGVPEILPIHGSRRPSPDRGSQSG